MSIRVQTQVKAAQLQKASLIPAHTSLLQRKYSTKGVACLDNQVPESGKKPLVLQRRDADQSDIDTVPPIVPEVLRSPGQPLDSATRGFMEPRFGHDFSQVRVHTDAKAAESAQAVNALAFTVGKDVVFGGGQYAPGVAEGKKLIAHELTHVVQQTGDGQPLGELRGAEVSHPTDHPEIEAEQASLEVLTPGNGVSPRITRHLARIARVPDAPDGHYTTKAGAVADVPAYVSPHDCFVWYAGHRHWRVIPGTPCAHFVAHQLNITRGLKCDAGFTIRVPDVLAGRTKHPLADAQVGDIWEMAGSHNHVGIVRAVDTDPTTGCAKRAQVEHDSSGKQKLATEWFTSGDFYR